jgi:hypothetical protein
MKINKYTILSILLGLTFTSIAQPGKMKYRRSSLSMILIESDKFPNKEAVMGSWQNFPFPDKYNKHKIDTKSININNIKLTDSDFINSGFLKDTLKGMKVTLAESSYNSMIGSSLTKTDARAVRYINKEKTLAFLLPSERQEFQIKIDKLINEGKLGNQLVASWFNQSSEGKFDMNLISERGFYNASEIEAGIAKSSTKGTSILADAGEELLKNTFVTFTKLDFYENEPIARIIRDAAKIEAMKKLAGKPQMVIDASMAAIDKTYEITKEGYSLWSKTWLYQLDWNDSVANEFYSKLWNNPQAFKESNLFKLKFVGNQYNQSLVTFKVGEKRSQEQIIDLALVRNIDNAFLSLQKEYDVFKPKVPVVSVNPITAHIGLKESLKGGEKFEVLELTVNEKTGLSEYVKVGKVKVNKKLIWDNRYNAGEKPENVLLDKDGKPITATVFKGSKKIAPGMLLKQIK